MIEPALPGVIGRVTASELRTLELPSSVSGGALEVTYHGRGVAVLVHVDEWMALHGELTALRARVRELEARE